ncbi:MAG: metallophosphoesterase [Planctomycetaceae bacterium]|jgi:predicted phosphodiesterase|nr:metallophosphoesterase [Planctomycetaceae bacterium]
MKRREFFSLGTIGLSAMFVPSLIYAQPETKNAENHIDNSNDKETIIFASEVKQSLSFLQISDSHISCDNESDTEYLSYSKRMGGGTVTQNRIDFFDDLLKKAKEEKVDFIALTGDIINYPSATAVQTVFDILKRSEIPFLYTAGNHDWHYEGMEGTEEELRQEWIEKRLKPLYQGTNPMCSSTLFKEINVVCIDNSTYQISEQQLEFYKEQRSKPEPIVLLMHIPLYMFSLGIFSCGHPDWSEKTDPYYKIERRLPWSKDGCTKTTKQFVQEVWTTPQLLSVFTGHTHRARTISSRNGGIQHIAAPALNGQYRLVQINNVTQNH